MEKKIFFYNLVIVIMEVSGIVCIVGAEQSAVMPYLPCGRRAVRVTAAPRSIAYEMVKSDI